MKFLNRIYDKINKIIIKITDWYWKEDTDLTEEEKNYYKDI